MRAQGFEAYFTVLIEALWPKRRIMEVYLNVIEWGPGIFGAEAGVAPLVRQIGLAPDAARSRAPGRDPAQPDRYRANPPGPYVNGRGYTIAARGATAAAQGADAPQLKTALSPTLHLEPAMRAACARDRDHP